MFLKMIVDSFLRRRIGLLNSGAFVLLLALADGSYGQDSKFVLSTGVDYTSGDYGGNEDIDDIYAPVTATYTHNSVGFKLTVPYLRVKAPTGTVITDASGQSSVGSGPEKIESGLGDIIGGVTFYDVFYSRQLDLAVDITAKIKFATADENKGLGTGENDYSAQADIYKYFDQFYISSSVGVKVRGDPPGLDLNNSWFASIGGNYRFTSHTRGGIAYDYRQSAFDNNDAVSEFSGFISVRLSNTWKLQLYVLKGLSDGSPDWGTGLRLKFYL